MPCDTRLKANQTLTQRKNEVRDVIQRTAALLASGKIRAIVDRRTGAIAFAGLSDRDRDGVTDACMYRRIMSTGGVAAKLAIARAEQMAGRSVSLQALAAGVHSHDNGSTWHHGH